MNPLLLMIVLPLVAAAAVPFMDDRRAKFLATIGTIAPFLVWLVIAATRFQWLGTSADQLRASWEWLPALGVKLSLGADVISMLLIGLTTFLGPIIIVGSYSAVHDREKTYYSWLLILQAAMTGVFAARDVVLFYVFFEFTLVPLYILINLFGSTNRKAAATKFFLYTFTGSLITLAAIVYVAMRHASGGEWSLDLAELGATARGMSRSEQWWIFWGLLAGFAIKVPLFPVHTWLPLAHTEAPTAGSVVLAGVLLKLGTYGMLRFALSYTPVGAVDAAPIIAALCIIGIIYAGLICWVQTDVKKLVAYSSVSHLGFCVLGLFAFNSIGLTGSILYMINHGLSTGALFLCIGMVYERYHTRSMRELGGLAAKLPIWATFMVFFTMASVGLPGLNGFVSEFMCLMGAFQAGGVELGGWSTGNTEMYPGATWGVLGPGYALIAGTGMIVAAMYLLYMLGKVVWGPLVEPKSHGHAGPSGGAHDDHGVKDLSAREIGVLLPLAAACLILGVYPRPILQALEEPTRGAAAEIEKAWAARDSLPPPPASPHEHGGEVETTSATMPGGLE
jgi:NADH-quinone oxidoreductase subunit M